MISDKFISDAANAKISAGGLTILEISQLSGAQPALDSTITKVNLIADLPDVAANLGRMIYVIEEEAYYYSNGLAWVNDYSSELGTYLATGYGWGYNGSTGRLGIGNITSTSSPVTVVGGLTWSQVSAGFMSRHSLGLTSDGIAYAWGQANYGQLGDGTTTFKLSPVTVAGGLTWSQVSAGSVSGTGTRGHSLGLTSNGIAYAWGHNGNGRLGDGTTTNRSSPVSVIGGITNWSQLSAGYLHNLGVTSSGIAYAWGGATGGVLGDGTETSKSSPVSVIGGITNWSQVSAGALHSLGLTSAGIAYAWGRNNYGNLGDGTSFTDRLSPVSVIGGITNWSQVSAGRHHSLGVTSSGIAYAWGQNTNGRLGDGTTTSRLSPVTVFGGITNWSQVSGGRDHSLGLTSTGVAYAWGINTAGQLGTGTTTSSTSPITVIGGITSWSQVSASEFHSLASIAVPKGF